MRDLQHFATKEQRGDDRQHHHLAIFGGWGWREDLELRLQRLQPLADGRGLGPAWTPGPTVVYWCLSAFVMVNIFYIFLHKCHRTCDMLVAQGTVLLQWLWLNFNARRLWKTDRWNFQQQSIRYPALPVLHSQGWTFWCICWHVAQNLISGQANLWLTKPDAGKCASRLESIWSQQTIHINRHNRCWERSVETKWMWIRWI